MTTFVMSQRFAIQTNGISSNAIDNEIVIVNLRNGFYYSLTELGAEIWSYVQAQWSVDQMIERIQERYEPDRASVSEWLVRFLSELEDEALIVRMMPSQTGDAAAMAGAAMMFPVQVPLRPPSLRKYTDLKEIVLQSGGPVRQSPLIELAITLDDLPGVRPGSDSAGQRAALDLIIDVFERHQVPPSYGFVNAVGLDGTLAAPRGLLDRWIAAGHRLGNHTCSHLDLHSVGAAAFVADIERNDAALGAWCDGDPAGRRVFRYPYLNAGSSAEERVQVLTYLRDRGYRVAEVTVDFGDWRWNHGRAPADVTFVAAGVAALRQARTLAGVLFRRPIKHILVLHLGAATAAHLDALLLAYAAEQARFMMLEEALQDPAYAHDATAIPSVGTWLNKLGRSGFCRLEP